MKILKVTEEYRTDSENEAKDLMERIRAEANENGYEVGANGYTYKEKKAKGEVIDMAWVVKVVKNYSTVWEV